MVHVLAYVQDFFGAVRLSEASVTIRRLAVVQVRSFIGAVLAVEATVFDQGVRRERNEHVDRLFERGLIY